LKSSFERGKEYYRLGVDKGSSEVFSSLQLSRPVCRKYLTAHLVKVISITLSHTPKMGGGEIHPNETAKPSTLAIKALPPSWESSTTTTRGSYFIDHTT
jgi:hypothetical protein